jgi:hypothetical protein
VRVFLLQHLCIFSSQRGATFLRFLITTNGILNLPVPPLSPSSNHGRHLAVVARFSALSEAEDPDDKVLLRFESY